MILSSRPVRLFRRLAAALLVTTSLTFAETALAQVQVNKDPVNVFFDSGFTYCDAKIVAALWKMDAMQAKAALGQKISRFGVPATQDILAAARQAGTVCEWADTPHSYADAERLATYWGLPDPQAAKIKVADLYTRGLSAQVTAALTASPAPAPSTDPYEAFFNAGYTYCDARLVAALWKTDTDTAKSAMGRKVVEGNQALIEPLLTQARGVARCEWADTPHSYADAERLATYWGLPDPQAAKIKVADLYTRGLSAQVTAALSPAPSTDPYEAFFNAGYTYCDAKLVAALWKTDTDTAKSTMGRKIVEGNQGLIAPLLTEARGVARCEWADTPHSYADAERLATYWGLPDPQAAKIKVADLYTRGLSAQVTAALSPPPSTDPYEAFFNAGYTYCDAKLVAALWQTDTDTAKSAMGRKIVEGNQALIGPLLTQARGVARCEWADLPYTYDDAVALGGIWGVPPDRAKAKAAVYYTSGQSQTVEAALGRTG